MKRVRHAKSGLFLMELVISILFFAVTAGICIRVFVKSHEISQNAKNLYQAQKEASSMAEILEGLNGKTGTPAEVLKEYFPTLEVSGETGCLLYYGEDWNACKKEKAVYQMSLTWQDVKANQRTVKIRFLDLGENGEMAESGAETEENEIYSLELKLYRGE